MKRVNLQYNSGNEREESGGTSGKSHADIEASERQNTSTEREDDDNDREDDDEQDDDLEEGQNQEGSPGTEETSAPASPEATNEGGDKPDSE